MNTFYRRCQSDSLQKPLLHWDLSWTKPTLWRFEPAADRQVTSSLFIITFQSNYFTDRRYHVMNQHFPIKQFFNQDFRGQKKRKNSSERVFNRKWVDGWRLGISHTCTKKSAYIQQNHFPVEDILHAGRVRVTEWIRWSSSFPESKKTPSQLRGWTVIPAAVPYSLSFTFNWFFFLLDIFWMFSRRLLLWSVSYLQPQYK